RARVVEPHHQPVPELLDDARAIAELAAHDVLLRREHLERLHVAAQRVELREAHDVREHHRALDRARARRRDRRHSGTTSIVPEIDMASMCTSSPAGKPHSTWPIVLKQASGAVPSGRPRCTLPETVFTAIGPSQPHAATMLPLTLRAFSAPATSSMLTEPHMVLTEALPARPIASLPATVLARQRPAQAPTRIEPLIVRESTASADSISILPLIVVTETSPNRPSSRTEPECVPTLMSVPAGQRTVRAPVPMPARICSGSPPSPPLTLSRSPSASTSSRGSAMTRTLPLRDCRLSPTATGSSNLRLSTASSVSIGAHCPAAGAASQVPAPGTADAAGRTQAMRPGGAHGPALARGRAAGRSRGGAPGCGETTVGPGGWPRRRLARPRAVPLAQRGTVDRRELGGAVGRLR